jgi:hypothetical protein
MLHEAQRATAERLVAVRAAAGTRSDDTSVYLDVRG